jgi:hypothetical protein
MSFRRSRMASFRETRYPDSCFSLPPIRRVTLQSNAKSSSSSFDSSYRFLESSLFFFIRPWAMRIVVESTKPNRFERENIFRCMEGEKMPPEESTSPWWELECHHHLGRVRPYSKSYAERIWQVNRGTLSWGSTLELDECRFPPFQLLGDWTLADLFRTGGGRGV